MVYKSTLELSTFPNRAIRLHFNSRNKTNKRYYKLNVYQPTMQ